MDPDAAITERLCRLGAATVYEAAGRLGAINPLIAPLGRPETIAGRALPVCCHPGDNLAVHLAVAVAAPGDILVIDGAGVRVGYVGDVLAAAARSRGVVGAIIDGGARDLAELERLDFRVWARGAAIPGASKVVPGSVGAPIICGGVAVDPADWVVADSDGVVIVAAGDLDETLAAATRRSEAEEDMRAALRDGALTLDLLCLRGALGASSTSRIEALRADRHRLRQADR